MAKRFIFTVLMLCMLVNTALAADFSKLVVLHTNDTHGFDQRAEGINGMATVAALKKDYEAKGYNVLLVDAGDAIQDNNLVNFSKGKSAIAFMNAAGYDAMTLGNHEFDYGQDVTLKRVKEAKFAVVDASVIVNATGKTLIQPHTIIQKGDVKIGVFGLSTPETAVSTNPKNVVGLSFLGGKDLYKAAQAQVDTLKAQGCDLVIALTHLGSSSANIGDRSNDVAANVNNLDIIIDGHDHQTKNLRINNTLVAETGFYTKNIGKIAWDGKAWQSELLPYEASRPQDAKVKALIEKTAAEVTKELSKKIGESTVTLDGTRAPGVRTKETNLGDFVADAYLWQARQAQVFNGKVDAAIVNGGGLRYSINKGVVTKGNIQAVLPYNNQLYVMKMHGSTLLEVLESATCISPAALGGFPQISGIKMTVNTKAPYEKGEKYLESEYFAPAKPGSRVTITSVGGAPFDMNKTYVVAMTEFQCNGGDAYGALKPLAGKNAQSIGYVDFSAVENYITTALKGKIGEEYSNADQRLVYVEK